MSALDDISYKLGALTEAIDGLRSNGEQRDRKLDTLVTQVGEIKTRMKPMAEDVAFMVPHVRHYRSVRRHVGWVGTVVLAFGGMFGGALGNWILKKYG